MQKQTQTYAEKVRQEGKGHKRGPPFVWAYLGLVKSLQQRGVAVGARTARRLTGPDWSRSHQCRFATRCVFCRLDKTYKADIKRITLNIVSPEKRLLVLEALSQTERKCGRAPPTATERELQTFSGRSAEDVKITVKAFLTEKGVQANSKAWHNAMQSEHVRRMAIAYFLAKRT